MPLCLDVASVAYAEIVVVFLLFKKNFHHDFRFRRAEKRVKWKCKKIKSFIKSSTTIRCKAYNTSDFSFIIHWMSRFNDTFKTPNHFVTRFSLLFAILRHLCENYLHCFCSFDAEIHLSLYNWKKKKNSIQVDNVSVLCTFSTLEETTVKP